MEISTQTETVTVVKFTLTLTDAELAAALVDPAPLQDALRSARGEQARGRHDKRNFTIARRGKKKEPAKAAAPKGSTTPLTCGACKRSFKTAHALKIHTVRSHKTPAAAPAETA